MDVLLYILVLRYLLIYIFFRKMTDEFYSFAFMIETPLHRIKNITTENSKLLSYSGHNLNISWKNTLNDDLIRGCITNVVIFEKEKLIIKRLDLHKTRKICKILNLSLFRVNDENTTEIKIKDCFEDLEFFLSFQYKNITFFR